MTDTATSQTKRVQTRVGRAMGTGYHMVVVGAVTGVIDSVEARLHKLENTWSRFLPESQISAINRNPDNYHIVSPETTELIARGKDAWSLTAGAFDPTVLDAVVANGYNRTFDECGEQGPVIDVGPAIGCAGFEVNETVNLVRLGANVRFDPGGIGKGLAADLLVAQAMTAGADGAMVNIGGDLVCRGRAPTADGWVIDVSEPAAGHDQIALLAIAEGAVATSTTAKRQWSTDDGPRHHLVNPETGRNTIGLKLATVLARDGWYAEAIAKHILVSGDITVVDTTRAAAIVITDDGQVITAGDMERFQK